MCISTNSSREHHSSFIMHCSPSSTNSPSQLIVLLFQLIVLHLQLIVIVSPFSANCSPSATHCLSCWLLLEAHVIHARYDATSNLPAHISTFASYSHLDVLFLLPILVKSIYSPSCFIFIIFSHSLFTTMFSRFHVNYSSFISYSICSLIPYCCIACFLSFLFCRRLESSFRCLSSN